MTEQDHSQGQLGHAGSSKFWWRRHRKPLAAVSGAVIPMIISIIAAAFSYSQVNAARQQNVLNEREELITFVADIAQEPQNLDQESATFIANPAALRAAQSGTQTTELVESEEAANLVRLLNGNGVTALEYLEIAVGLEAGQSDFQALHFLGIAASIKNTDPRTQASILHAEATIFYSLGGSYYPRAERDDARSETVYENAPDGTFANRQSNLAFSELFDAYYQATISCPTALKEEICAMAILKETPAVKSPGMILQETQTEKALTEARCPRLTHS
jgi:hypothetical protein